MIGSAKGNLVSQFPTNGEQADPGLVGGRDPYRTAPPRPPSAAPEQVGALNVRAAMLDIDDDWPASVSRDAPEKLSAETRGHTFFVRTKRRELLSNIDVLGFIAKCPDAGDGHGVVVHRDVIRSLGYHLLDKVHELEELRKNRSSAERSGRAPPSNGEEGSTEKTEEPRYDERLSKALDTLGDKDAEIKELKAALGDAAVKIRRLESKLYK